MLVETLIHGSPDNKAPRIVDFEDAPLLGDFVYLPTPTGEQMFVIVARFWRRTDKPELSTVLGIESKVVRRRHTLFVGLKPAIEIVQEEGEA
jgi:hypothetical protein